MLVTFLGLVLHCKKKSGILLDPFSITPTALFKLKKNTPIVAYSLKIYLHVYPKLYMSIFLLPFWCLHFFHPKPTAALLCHILSFELCNANIDFSFPEIPHQNQGATISWWSASHCLLSPVNILLFSQFLPEHITDPRGDLIFAVFFMSNICQNICFSFPWFLLKSSMDFPRLLPFVGLFLMQAVTCKRTHEQSLLKSCNISYDINIYFQVNLCVSSPSQAHTF